MKNKNCSCKNCIRNRKFVKIANKNRITKKDKIFLLDILDQLVHAEEYLSWEEDKVQNIINKKQMEEKDVLNKMWDDLFQSKKEKDEVKTNLLSTLISEIQAVGKNDGNRNTTNEEAILIIKKFLKNIDITIDALKSKSPESIHLEGLIMEKSILSKYLPSQIDKDSLKNIIKEFIDEQKVDNLGAVMKFLKEKYNGQYNGKDASEITKGFLMNE